ncbi:MAG: hypothetical protein LIP77_05065 [Planctomycetes bacterium]|nr:hypothetical protein [Planctomycetota bacterium]
MKRDMGNSGEEVYPGSGGALIPDAQDFTRVDVERMDDYAEPAGPAAPGVFLHIRQGFLRPPILSAWLCLAAAWFFLGSPIPMTVFIGLPLAIAAVILAAVCLTRGGLFTGLAVMFLGTAGSLVAYLYGWVRLLTFL